MTGAGARESDRPGTSQGPARARLSGSGDLFPVSPHDVRLESEPIRMCCGCRGRDLRSVLLRVVVAEVDGQASVVPDSERTQAGRGASLHRDLACLDAAERRRAFPRALRHPGPLDVAPVRAFLVAVRCSPVGDCAAEELSDSTVLAGSGSETDEHPMSPQR